jgi:hypothetical protein
VPVPLLHAMPSAAAPHVPVAEHVWHSGHIVHELPPVPHAALVLPGWHVPTLKQPPQHAPPRQRPVEHVDPSPAL